MIKGYEEIVSFGRGNLDALVQSGTLAAKGGEEVAKAFVALGNHNVERMAAAAKAVAGARTPADLLHIQAQLTRDHADSLASETRRIADIVSTVLASALEPLQARVKAAGEFYKAA